MVSLDEVEQFVRSGKVEEARKELDRLNRKGKWAHCNPRHLANLLWRTGSPLRGIRLLRQTFLEITAPKLKAKPEEAAEYAACLTRVGAFLEAEWILNLPEVAATPMASLYLGLSLVTRWEYPQAVPLFASFVKRKDIPEYQRLIGYANLAAGLVHERRHAEATSILRRLLHDSQLTQNFLLTGFVLEVAAADKVLSGNFKEAHKLLAESDRKWATADDYHRSLIEKWTALLALAEKKDQSGVERMRTRARETQDWETLRDCEKYLALWTKDEALFLRVYFGTPYAAFRDRFLKDFGNVTIPAKYGVPLSAEKGKAKGKPADIRFLVDELERKRTGLTSQSYALASLLSSDLYRPHRLATLYGWLYPDQHFHPDHIGKRMSQAVRRLNVWAEENKVPLFAAELDSTYQLQAERNAVLWVPRPGNATLSWQPLIVRLENFFADKSFSTGDAIKALAQPRSSLVRHLQSLVVSGQLVQTGSGPSSRYQIKRRAKAA